MAPSRQSNTQVKRGGFVVVELAVVVVMVMFLAAICGQWGARLRERSHIVIDLSNLRQILRASALYNSENNDLMAHPTWGGGLTGPDGWAYLTSKENHPVPGATMRTPGSCTGVDVNSARFTNQLAFFKAGQVSRYLPDVKTAWCPKDVATRRSGFAMNLWYSRAVKVTSYGWTGSIGGYAGPVSALLPSGKTYKVSRFLPSDWQMWEKDDSTGFSFSDAGVHPEDAKPFSLRHAAVTTWIQQRELQRNYTGGVVVGTFGGGAEFVSWPKVYDLITRKVAAPNELLNGPGYQRN